MKKLNKILSVGLSLAMCAGMVVPALAASYCINEGSVTISSRDDSVWVKHGDKDEVEDKDTITVTGTGDVTQNTITVGENVKDVNITLENVNIDTGNTKNAAIDIGKDSSVTIELDGTNEVKSGDDYVNADKAGVNVGEGASLTINDANGTAGSLTATGGYRGGAGIGGERGKAAGNITINGGTVTATGGGAQIRTTQGGAGIGSGGAGSVNSVTINGGTVTATGGFGGAGIGAGHTGTFGDITVKNGTVTANGGTWAAGIGTGRYDSSTAKDANSINIKGGVVTATGGAGNGTAGNDTAGGAGIGTGITLYQQKVGQINITGGTVNATGKNMAAGIGSARGSWSGISQRVDEISISGDATHVTATGGPSAAGIGAGAYSKVGKVGIGGGTVEATGTTGIGTGNSNSEVGTVNISGGDVTATGEGGAGIGSSSGGTKVETIDISGGKVTATGWSNAAGIGGGSGGSFGAINITGGDITAKSGINASGIGNGTFDKGGTITITGVDKLMVLGDGQFAIDTRANVDGVEQSILNGRFKEGLTGNGLTLKEPTTFIVVDVNNKQVAKFTLDPTFDASGKANGRYESFALNLPAGKYYVFESSGLYNNSIAGYQEKPGKQIAYVIDTGKMLTVDDKEKMQFPDYSVGYKFESATEGKELPKEITDMELGGSTGNKLTYESFQEMVKRADSFEKVHTEDGGTWSFNTWTEMRPVTADGQKITDVELVGTWSFCGHENKTTTNIENPTCTEPGKSQTVCDDCGEVLSTDEVPALDHDYGEWTVETAATCTEAGLERRVCSRDGSHVEEREIPATDHDWDDGVITRQPTETEEGEITYTCRHDPSHTYTVSIDRLEPGIDIEDPDVPLGEEPEVEIEDPRVPLAGLFTRADAIGYLWEQTGSPDAELSDFPDVPEDHYWAVAIGWAQDMGIALPDEEGNFRPDDLVLRSSNEPEGELQEFLDRYAVFAGVELAAGKHFYVVAGVSDDIVMGEDAQVIFDEFFAKLEAALTEQAA